MRPFKGLGWGCALALLAACAGPAPAAWNNVFQVCGHHGAVPAPAPVVTAGFGADPCCPPQQQCTTRYVQRSCYQPVTTYRTTTYSVPVTTYRTSYYCEPVTSCRYVCRFNPCTCRYETVAQPVVSYRLRAQCCPVTSYMQRTCLTPVTTMQLTHYWVPETTCCTTTTGAPVACPPNGATTVPNGAAAVPGTQETRGEEAPAVPAPPGTEETRDGGGTSRSEFPRFERNPGLTPPGKMPRAEEGSRRAPVRPPVVRLDRIASRTGATLEGKVVDGGRQPLGGAKVLFVSAESKATQERATADADGAFSASLSAGGWLVYTYDADGKPVFSRRVEVPASRSVSVTLVSR
jgi:hypothetical protein